MSARGFRHAGHTPTLLAALVHFDVSFMVWVLLGALGAYVAKDLGLSAAQKGVMVAVPALGGAAFRLIVGPLADRAGTKRTGLVTLALTLVPLGWGWLAGGTYPQVLGIGALLGVAGASFVVALPLASRWYPPEHQGLALGIAGAGNSGTLIAALAAPRVAEHVGWHGAFGVAAVPVALAWLVFALLAKEPPRPAASASDGKVLSLLEEPDARWLCSFYLVTFGGFVGLAAYLPIFFVDSFGLARVSAGGYAALCAAAGSFLRPLGGAIADRVGGGRVLGAALGLVAALSLALATGPALLGTVAVLFVVLGALGIGNGAVFQLVGNRFPARMGAMSGLVGAAGGVGGFLLPFAFGSLRGATGGFAAGFVLFAVVAGCASFGVDRCRRVWRAMGHRPELEVAV
ncbi:MAG: MFS transporter [Actinomycetota bacterium]|nr:MFS transporter [Actinomycetota bacterium]PLS74978.1 MAG: MFS transporter [Actinomycetota bacterium]